MRPRPLSPHLQIYRPQISSVLSIIHRLTGAGLTISLFFFIGWLISLSLGESAYTCFVAFMKEWFGQLVIWLSVFAFYYHLSNGIRHLIWDTGHGFELSTMHKSGWTVIIVAIAATLLTWSFA